MFISIRNKILLSQVSLIILTIFCLGFFSYLFMVKYIITNDQKVMEKVTKNIVDYLNHIINNKRNILLRIAKNKEFEDYHVTYRDILLSRYLSKFQVEFPVLSYVNEKGVEQVKVINGDNSEDLKDLSADSSFKEALNNKNQVAISVVVDSLELKKPVLRFYLANYSYFEDQFQGVASASLPIENIRDEMKQFDLAQKFNFMLIDSKSDILCDSQDRKTGGKIAISDIKTGKLIGQENLLQKAFLRVNFGGVDSFIFVVPVWIHDWVICIYLPYKDFMSAPAVLAKANISISLSILFLSIIVSVLLAKYLTVPISKLLKGTNAVANGNFGQQLHIQTHDEIRQLGEAFNKMSISLQTTVVSKDYIDSIIEGMLETLIVLNECAEIKSVNAALCRLLGYNKEELINQDINFITGGIDIISKMIDNSKISGALKLENYEINYHSKDGVEIPVILSCSEIVDKKSGETNYIVTASDVRQQKQTEKALKDAYDKLKTLQSQLLQAEKMIAIGQLAGGVAHEINNPLTGVLNNVQLIKMIAQEKKGSNIEDFKDILNSIEESALRCKRIVASLLDLARVSNVSFQNIGINTVINQAVNLISEDIKLQNISLKLELQPGMPDIRGDSQLLEQSIIDIVSNAKWAVKRKFQAKPGGGITLRSEYFLGSGYVDLYIMDNGVGIPESEIGRIFEPFFTTKDVGEGTGLGLSLVYNIIKKHDGKIEVKSKVNEGTTFKVSLPVIV